jgi:hypothetical protein
MPFTIDLTPRALKWGVEMRLLEVGEHALRIGRKAQFFGALQIFGALGRALLRRKQAEVDLTADGFDDIPYQAIRQLSIRRLRTGDLVIDLTHAADGEERMLSFSAVSATNSLNGVTQHIHDLIAQQWRRGR